MFFTISLDALSYFIDSINVSHCTYIKGKLRKLIDVICKCNSSFSTKSLNFTNEVYNKLQINIKFY